MSATSYLTKDDNNRGPGHSFLKVVFGFVFFSPRMTVYLIPFFKEHQ